MRKSSLSNVRVGIVRQPVWERVAIFVFGVGFVATILVIAIYFPYPSQSQYETFKVVLALAAAGVAALVPGFLDVQLSSKHIDQSRIRAGGALAVFVVVYFFSPAGLVTDPKKLQLTRLVERQQTGDISKLIQDEKAFWSNKDIGKKVIEYQDCIAKKTCNSQELQLLMRDTLLNKGNESQLNTVTKISEFYMDVARQANSGTIGMKDACACFGAEIETWQRSYLYVLDLLTKINSPKTGYQETLSNFAIQQCSEIDIASACRG